MFDLLGHVWLKEKRLEWNGLSYEMPIRMFGWVILSRNSDSQAIGIPAV